MQNSESGIPVLTEVLEVPVAAALVVAASAAFSSSETVLQAAAVDAAPESPPDVFREVFSAASHEISPEVIPRDGIPLADIAAISEAVLEKLLGRLDEVLEPHIRDQLAVVLHDAVNNLACQLRAGLKQALGESISIAVAAELDMMRESNIEKE